MDLQTEGDGIKVKRELEAGFFQWVTMPLPGVFTIQSGINTLRYATLKGIMAAKKKEIKKLDAAALGLDAATLAPKQQIKRVYFPQKSKQTQMIEGTAAAAAATLVEKLKNEARVF
jgi:electron transfer flavoprotein beta subunit